MKLNTIKTDNMTHHGYNELIDGLIAKTVQMDEAGWLIESLYYSIVKLCHDPRQLEILNENINRRIQCWIDELLDGRDDASDVSDGYSAKMAVAYRMYDFDQVRAFAISDEILQWKDVWEARPDVINWNRFLEKRADGIKDSVKQLRAYVGDEEKCFESLITVDEERAFLCLHKLHDKDQLRLIGKYIGVIERYKSEALEIAKTILMQDIEVYGYTLNEILSTLPETEIEDILKTMRVKLNKWGYDKDTLLLNLVCDKKITDFEIIDHHLSEKGILSRKAITAFKNAQIDDAKRLLSTIETPDISLIYAYIQADRKEGYEYLLAHWDSYKIQYSMRKILPDLLKEDKSFVIQALIQQKNTDDLIKALIEEGLLDFDDILMIVENVMLQGYWKIKFLEKICDVIVLRVCI